MGDPKRVRQEDAEIIPLWKWLPTRDANASGPVPSRPFIERREWLRGRARERLVFSHVPSILLHVALIGLGPCVGLGTQKEAVEQPPLQISLIPADQPVELPPSAQKFLAEYAAQNALEAQDAQFTETGSDAASGAMLTDSDTFGVSGAVNATTATGSTTEDQQVIATAINPDAQLSTAPATGRQNTSPNSDAFNDKNAPQIAVSPGFSEAPKPEATPDGPIGWLHWVRSPKGVQATATAPQTRNISTKNVDSKKNI